MFSVKNAEHHFLLSGDTDGAIILWEFSVADREVFLLSSFIFSQNECVVLESLYRGQCTFL